MGLITVPEFKALPLGMKDLVLDKIGDLAIAGFIETASEQVANHCGRQLETAEVVQEIEGNGEYQLLLREYPVTELESVEWEDGLGQTGEDDVTDFRVSRGGVLKWKSRLDGPFVRSRLYTVTYTAGYTAVPGPIKHATALWATELMQPMYNQHAGGKAVALVELSSEQIVELLEDYRRKGAR